MAWLESVARIFRGANPDTYTASRAASDEGAWSLPYATAGRNASSAPYGTALGLDSTTSIALPGASSTVALDLELPLPVSLQGRSSLRESNVARAFRRIRAFCDAQYEEMGDTINYPATSADIAELSAALGFELPPAVYEWFLCCNGQEPESKSSCNDGLFFGLPFLSTDRVADEWHVWRIADRDPRAGANKDLRARMASCPAGWVKEEYSCPGWVPLVTDHMGNYIGVDMTPPAGGGGSPGQVIIFGRDFDTKVVLYGCDGIEGWSKFLLRLADDLEAGIAWSATEDDDEDDDVAATGEDSIGYESYFYGGTAGTSRGGGDAGGDGLAAFRLVGEYRNWPPLEAWADRARRQWETAGLTASVPRTAERSASAHSSPLVGLQHHTPSDSPSLGSARSAEKRRAMSLAEQEDRRHSAPLRTRPLPPPAPIADLPTLEEVRALQASEAAADAAAAHSSQSPFVGVRDSLASIARVGSQPLSYRNVLAQRSGVFDDGVELSHRSNDASFEQDLTEMPSIHDTAMLGSRGTRLREADEEDPYARGHVQPADTRVLIDGS